jgi:hypothetical protein
MNLAQTPAGSSLQKIQTKDLLLTFQCPTFHDALREFKAKNAGLKHHAAFEAQMKQITKIHEETPPAPPAFKNASLSNLPLLGKRPQPPSKSPGFGGKSFKFVSHKKQKISQTPTNTRRAPSRKVNQAPRGNLPKSKAQKLDTLVT